jgi:glucose-6-phosphate-specific signal transduction histidine kinase
MSCGMTSTRHWDTTRVVLPVVAAAAAGAAAVLVRNHYDFEDTAAIVTLVAACLAAALGAAAVALILRADRRSCLVHAVTAGVLVTPLIAFYYLLRMFTTADYS